DEHTSTVRKRCFHSSLLVLCCSGLADRAEAGSGHRRCGVYHEEKTFSKQLARLLWESSQCGEQLQLSGVQTFQLTEELLLDFVSEKFRKRDVVRGNQLHELRQLHRHDAVTGLERRDGLLAYSRELGDFFLRHTAQAPQFA